VNRVQLIALTNIHVPAQFLNQTSIGNTISFLLSDCRVNFSDTKNSLLCNLRLHQFRGAMQSAIWQGTHQIYSSMQSANLPCYAICVSSI
jgi:hypothetical protein